VVELGKTVPRLEAEAYGNPMSEVVDLVKGNPGAMVAWME